MSEKNEDDDYILRFSEDRESFLNTRSNNLSRGSRRNNSLIRPERSRFNDPSNPHFFSRRTNGQKESIPVHSSGSIKRGHSLRSRSLRSGGSDPARYPSSQAGYTTHSGDVYQLEDLTENPDVDQQKNSEQEEIFEISGDENELMIPSAEPLKLQKRPERSKSLWQIYCYVITFWAPAPILALCGMPKKERQMAWRDKIALLSVIGYIGAIVAYITFGFTKTVCKNDGARFKNNEIDSGLVIIGGKAYAIAASAHPEVPGLESGSIVLFPPEGAGGMDLTFMFQNVNGNCHNLIKPRDNATTPHDDDNNMAWYFPCKMVAQDGSTKPNFTKSEYYEGWACHTSDSARQAYYDLRATADVYYSWDDIKNSSRNLVVYNGHVLDLNLLDWLEKDQLTYPPLFDELKTSNLQGYDLSLILSTAHEKKAARCLSEIIKVGEIDSKSVGCIASDIVLYVSLVLIFAVVIIKFLIACYFRWSMAKNQGATVVDNKTMERQLNAIEDWSENIDRQGPIKQVDPSLRPIKKNKQHYGHKKSTSKFDILKKHSSKMLNLKESIVDLNKEVNDNTFAQNGSYKNMTTMTLQHLAFNSAKSKNRNHTRNQSTLLEPNLMGNRFNEVTEKDELETVQVHPDIVQQPPASYMPYDYPLIHTICFVTCYSEDEEGLRTTLDSLSTTDYPNSHKLIMILCDGLIKGSGNDLTTPEIALGMMEDFAISPEEVQPYSYVAVAAGTKRHNMAKIYAGFYKYDDNTVPPEKQQRVPVITIVKCGTPDEQGSAKPGNRGKRDSQVILMSFLQKMTFDERMTELEYQLLRNIYSITGLMADFYETVLMVDADTKVFPDSLSHMVAEMVKDPAIMGLCGETKIANKRQSWVTAIQVFEYYISHHQSKAFESVFGSVTCLPGCFSIYRIKSPKGLDGFWVPVLANADIVERYSDNVTDSLHKKNLLLLGEDRYLSSLMLKTFPKRKQVFVPKAACKTIAPDEFKVLLSQRRRWINSTVHNLFELVLIRDLCGTFCFSMQFVIFIELIGTLVLPLAIVFTIYVIIFAIVSKPTPTLTLIMLAVILGLPGLIVVVTATRWSYLVWMAIYILALPIWNFVLPSYAYWKFDDFSWGDTRTIAGGNAAAGGHDDEDGEFDHSKIKMRTWREFERENQIANQTSFSTFPIDE